MASTSASELPLDMDHDNERGHSPISVDEQSLSAQRASRKREREVSLEPQTPKSDNEELPPAEARERKAHVTKKNRLESVAEQHDQESPPRSPPLNPNNLRPNSPPDAMFPSAAGEGSPKDESKIQQIREKVHDMTWQDKEGQPNDETMHEADVVAELSATQPIVEEGEQDHPIVEDVAIPNADPSPGNPRPDDDGVKTPTGRQSPVPPAGTAEHKEDITLPDAAEHVQGPPAVAVAALVNGDDTERPQTPTPSKPIPIPGSSAHPRRGSDSDNSDPENLAKSPTRKRKLIERESSYALDNEEHFKRAKDDESKAAAEKDEIAMSAPRHLTPPPRLVTPPPAAAPRAAPKAIGFASFASASGASPLAQTTGNAFSSGKPIAPQPKPAGFGSFGGFISSSLPTSFLSSSMSPFGAVSGPTATAVTAHNPSRNHTPEATPRPPSHPNSPNRSRSPSASALNRKKSPPLASTKIKSGPSWGGLNGGSAGFADLKKHSPSPSQDAVSRQPTLLEGDVEEGASVNGGGKENVAKIHSWREMLGASAADASASDPESSKKMVVEEIEVTTGEEDEDTRYQVRAKLYQLDGVGAYKERGVGLLKIKVRKTDQTAVRLVMRADAVHRLILNAGLFRGMAVSNGPDPKYVKMTSLEDGKPVHYAIKVGSMKAAEELYEAIEEHILPDDRGVAPSAPVGV